MRRAPLSDESPHLDQVFVSQRRDADGTWRTLGSYQPSPGQSPLGLCALRDGGRVVLPESYVIDRLPGALQFDGVDHLFAGAEHSRLGSMDLATASAAELTADDQLTVIYEPSASVLRGATGCYLQVRPADEAESSAQTYRREPQPAAPTRFALHPGQPNPPRGVTTFAFDLPVESTVTLEVFDLLGRKVAVLTDATHPAGTHSVQWNLRDRNGASVAPGVYICRMAAGEFRARQKVSVTR